MNLSTPANILILCLYYVLVGILSFFSAFGVYVLIRYGKSMPVTLAVGIIYSLFYLKILAESYATLHSLLS